MTKFFNYTESKYKHLDVVLSFLESCYKSDFKHASHFVIPSIVNNANQCEQIFNNCYRVGPFMQMKSATVLHNNGHVYCIAQHSNDDYQWVFYVCLNSLKIAGWDQKMNGSFRNPSENGQQIKEIVNNKDAVVVMAPSIDRSNCSPSTSNQPSIQMQDAMLKNRFIRFEWETSISRSDLTKDGLVELLMPTNRPFQRHHKFQLLTPSFQFVDHYELNGNNYVRVKPPSFLLSTRVSYSLDIEFDPMPIQTGKYRDQWNLSTDNPSQYLGITYHTSARIDPTHPHMQSLCQKIIAPLPKDASPIQIAKAIAYFVGNIPYQMIDAGMNWPTLDQYINSGYKYMECGGHAIFFTTLCRAAGIPARRLFHPWIVTNGHKFERFDSHCIAEFYHKDYGWIPVDATNKFNETNNQQWFRLPKPLPGFANGIAMTAESMDGKELRSVNAKQTNTLQKCKVTLLN